MNVRTLIVTAGLVGATFAPMFTGKLVAKKGDSDPDETTPIKHVVVIFGENISFDHYFGSYPHALNLAGEPKFDADPATPTANTLVGGLLTNNPNFLNPDNGAGRTNPFRLGPAQAVTADQDHDYGPEQLAFNHGLMDLFPKSVGTAGPPPPGGGIFSTKGLVMGFYDGNTVTALWNYAQQFAMNDNSFGTNFGPSTVGALNLASGQTNGIVQETNGPTTDDEIDDGAGGLTVVGDPDPFGDKCSTTTGNTVQMGGRNIGNLLNDAGVTWGWFQGGFDLTLTNTGTNTTGCNRSSTTALITSAQKDYVPHHEPFQYYSSTANPMHLRPSSVMAIGQTDQANHQYDINDFYAAVSANNMPAVSFLKAPKVENGHAGTSDPIDEQRFIVHVLNFLQERPEWKDTAVILAYDDSDGWYDHAMSPIVNQSATTLDELSAPGQCGNGAAPLEGINTLHAQGRCGYGPRLPLVVVSPWAKTNFIDHTVTDQTSIIRFIEDNWLGGERIGQGSFDAIAHSIRNMFDFDQKGHKGDTLLLDESTGEPVKGKP